MIRMSEHHEFRPANDVAGQTAIVDTHPAARHAERRLMLVIAFLTVAVLVSSLADGYILAEALPDLTTFAGRV